MTFVKTEPHATVPEGHQLVVYTLHPVPLVSVCEGGVVLAQFGFGGDDPEEVLQVVEDAAREVKGQRLTPSRSGWVRKPCSLSDLFQTAPPATDPIRRTVVWTVCQDGLWPLLAESTGLQRLLTALGRIPFDESWLVVDAHWRVDSEFREGLRRLRIAMFQALPDGAFLAQVLRPDGLRIFGFVGQDPAPAPPGGGLRPLFRSTRFTRRIFDAMAQGTDASFHEELLARQDLLVFLVDLAERPRMVSWPGQTSVFLAAYADLSSLHRAAREIGLPAGSYGVGGLSAKAILEWAQKDGFGVVIGVFPEQGAVRYLRLDVARGD